MKFKNIETEITMQINEQGDKKTFGYFDIALIGLNSRPQDGWTVKDMKDIFKLIDKLEGKELGKSIEITEEELATIKSCNNIKWNIMHKDIISFDDYIEKLK